MCQTDSRARCQNKKIGGDLICCGHFFSFRNLKFVNLCVCFFLGGGGGTPGMEFLYSFPNLDLAKHFSLSTKRFTM